MPPPSHPQPPLETLFPPSPRSPRNTQHPPNTTTTTTSNTTVQPQTQTQTQTLTTSPTEPIVLRLRGADTTSSRTRPTQRRIQWTAETVDNEHLNRKKSKVCCIFHRARAVGESSSEEGSSSSSSSSSGSEDEESGEDDGRARMVGRGASRRIRRQRRCEGEGDEHEHGHGHGHGHEHGDGDKGCPGGSKKKGSRKSTRRPSPNAYERMPKYRVEPLKQQP